MPSLLKYVFFVLGLPLISCYHSYNKVGLEDVSSFNERKIQSTLDDMDTTQFRVVKTEEQWRNELDELSYYVLRQKGTERPYTSEFESFWEEGIYVCKGCDTPLFESKTKFDAGCGWPSFYQSIDKKAVIEKLDKSHGMVRTEVLCAHCGGHLGHVFNDGFDQPTGLRYCINGVSLGFKKKGQ
jgi:peptide-methionine (R)-S-oxide reductase